MQVSSRLTLAGWALLSLVSCVGGAVATYAANDELVQKGQVVGVILKRECVVTDVGQSAQVIDHLAHLRVSYRCRLKISTDDLVVVVENNNYNVGQAVKLVPQGKGIWVISSLR